MRIRSLELRNPDKSDKHYYQPATRGGDVEDSPSPLSEEARVRLKGFLTPLDFFSRKEIRGWPTRTVSSLVASAVLTSVLVTGLDQQSTICGIEQKRAIEHFFRRLFRTNAATPGRVQRVQHAAELLLSQKYEWLSHLDFAPGDSWGPGQHFVNLAVGAREAAFRVGLSDVDARAALAGIGNLAAVALQMVARIGAMKVIRDLGPIRLAVFEDFRAYFDHLAGLISRCSDALDFPIEISVKGLPYRELYIAARDPNSPYHIVMLDDPWLSELLFAAPPRFISNTPFSSHRMVFCLNRKFRPMLDDVLGERAVAISGDHWTRMLRRPHCGVSGSYPKLILPNLTVQEPYTIARQICNNEGAFCPTSDDLRNAYNQSMLSPMGGKFRKIGQAAAIDEIGSGRSFNCAPVFLGHAVATSNVGQNLEFLPFQDGGVSGDWHLGIRVGSEATALEMIVEILAQPVDPSIQLDYGISPPCLTSQNFRRPTMNPFLSQRWDEIAAFHANKSFSRYTGEDSFVDVAAGFNTRIDLT